MRLVRFMCLMAWAFGSSGWASEAPVTVSPGSNSRVARVASHCPTFSWGAYPGTESYELVVYRLAAGDSEPLLEQRVAGQVSSWTPSLGRCFERGARYAWSVRALAEQTASDWSTPRMFEVVPEPSPGELSRALATVRRYLERERAGQGRAISADGEATEDSLVEAVTLAPDRGRRIYSGAAPTLLSVDGNVDAVSFSGDGSGLTSLDPASLSAAVPIDKGGTGATSAVGARASLGVVAGPHSVDTNTNAATLCGPNQLLDGDGGCVSKVGLNDLTGCDDGEVPTLTGGSWGCGPAVVFAAVSIPNDGTTVYAECPDGKQLLTGGWGGDDNCYSGTVVSLTSDGAVAQHEFGTVIDAAQDRVSCRAEELLCTGGDCTVLVEEDCDCFAICR